MTARKTGNAGNQYAHASPFKRGRTKQNIIERGATILCGGLARAAIITREGRFAISFTNGIGLAQSQGAAIVISNAMRNLV
jgi:hypothetical protein